MHNLFIFTVFLLYSDCLKVTVLLLQRKVISTVLIFKKICSSKWHLYGKSRQKALVELKIGFWIALKDVSRHEMKTI